MLKGVVQFWQTGPLCLTGSSGYMILCCRHYRNLEEAVEDFFFLFRVFEYVWLFSEFSVFVNSMFNSGLRLLEWMKCMLFWPNFCSGCLCTTLKRVHWLWKKAQAQIMTSRETYVCSFWCLYCILHSDRHSAIFVVTCLVLGWFCR